MLFQLRKENIELNDEYNKMINEKTKLEVKYVEMKKRLEKYEEKEEHENREQFESLNVFIEPVRNISNSNVSDSIVISSLITSKKLFDSFILIDEKDSNIEN
jgi:predicted nuclease with TOPRIM domain